MSRGKNDDWISEHIYKKYTETDSRPLSPAILQYRAKTKSRPNYQILESLYSEQFINVLFFERRGGHDTFTHRRKSIPEPSETSICHVHQRRVLILDLRKVKSVDIVTRQDSLSSTGTCSAVDGDGDKADDDPCNPPSTSTQVFSGSRSSIPKKKMALKRRFRKPEGPVEYERSTSPKILEGVSTLKYYCILNAA